MRFKKKLFAFIIIIVLACFISMSDNIMFAAGNNPSMINVHFYGDSKTSRGITWSTDNETNSHVQVVKKTSDTPDFTNSTLYEGETRTLTLTPNNKPQTLEYIHQVKVDNLEPGSTYYYRVGDKDINNWSTYGTIETPIVGLNKFTFFHMSDVQSPSKTGVARYKSVLNTAYTMYPDGKFIAFTGDYVENSDYKEQWQWAFDDPNEYLMNTTIASTVGNHDKKDDQDDIFVSRFYTPYPNGIDTKLGSYYSYDYGNAHFAVLNTNDTTKTTGMNTVQLEWLENDLSSSNKDWKIVQLHKGLYTTGNKVSVDTDILYMREQVVPIMIENDVDIVLQGHDHLYIRTKPQKLNGQGFDTPEIIEEYYNGEMLSYMVEPNGIIYINNNTAGGGTFYDEIDYDKTKVFPVKSGQPKKQMFAAITIDDNNLMYRSYTVQQNEISGQPDVVVLFDEFNIKKSLERDLIKKIDSLPNLDDLKGTERGYILELLSDYRRLSPDIQLLVTNYQDLIDADKKVKDILREKVIADTYGNNNSKWQVIVGITAGSLVVCGGIGFALWYFIFRKRGVKS